MKQFLVGRGATVRYSWTNMHPCISRHHTRARGDSLEVGFSASWMKSIFNLLNKQSMRDWMVSLLLETRFCNHARFSLCTRGALLCVCGWLWLGVSLWTGGGDDLWCGVVCFMIGVHHVRWFLVLFCYWSWADKPQYVRSFSFCHIPIVVEIGEEFQCYFLFE